MAVIGQRGSQQGRTGPEAAITLLGGFQSISTTVAWAHGGPTTATVSGMGPHGLHGLAQRAQGWPGLGHQHQPQPDESSLQAWASCPLAASSLEPVPVGGAPHPLALAAGGPRLFASTGDAGRQAQEPACPSLSPFSGGASSICL